MPSNANETLLRELESGLRALEEHSQRRSLVEIRGVNLCSNDYLGLAEHAGLRAAVLEAVSKASRVGGTGSRLLSGHCVAWEEVEQEFAEFVGTAAAFYFGSGYAANVGLLTSLAGKSDVIFSDELNHASLIDGIRLSGARKVIYPHLDLNALESALRQYANDPGRKLVVSETVFSMDGDVAPVAELLVLAERYGAGLILDEAHAIAVHGPSGRGVAAAAGVLPDIFASIHPCGKALASAGAFVCGSAVLKEHLLNHARTFIFTTAMPPYMAEQIRAALRLAKGMDGERAELLARSRGLAQRLRAQGWDTAGSTTQIIPAIVGGNEEALAASRMLQQEGFAVRAIRPPTVAPGSSRLRFSLTCSIAANDLQRLETILDSQRAQKNAHALAGNA